MDDTLFRVHRYYFTRESQIFADMFSLPAGSSEMIEGKSDTSPIEIPGVMKQEMESFLSFVYFGCVLVLGCRDSRSNLTISDDIVCTMNTPSH